MTWLLRPQNMYRCLAKLKYLALIEPQAMNSELSPLRDEHERPGVVLPVTRSLVAWLFPIICTGSLGRLGAHGSSTTKSAVDVHCSKSRSPHSLSTCTSFSLNLCCRSLVLSNALKILSASAALPSSILCLASAAAPHVLSCRLIGS